MDAATTQDYYAVLGLDARADDEALRRAWRRLTWTWHPDRAGPSAAATFREISIAYSVLSDPEARAAYDRSRCACTSDPRVLPARSAPGVRLSRLSGPSAWLPGMLRRSYFRVRLVR